MIQFHIAVISIMAFVTLAVYANQAISAKDTAFPSPLPHIQGRVEMDREQAASSVLSIFNAGR